MTEWPWRHRAVAATCLVNAIDPHLLLAYQGVRTTGPAPQGPGRGTGHGSRMLTLPISQVAAIPIGGRYGAVRRVSPTTIGITIAIHLALLAAMLSLQVHGTVEATTRIVAVDLHPASLPPSPAAPQVQPDTPPPPAAFAPQPPVILPRPTPPMMLPPELLVSPPTVPAVSVRIEVAAPMPAAAPPAPPAPPGLVQATDLATRMVSGPPPRYPTQSRSQREQGTVVLAVVLGTDGRVAQISVAQSSGFSRLDDAALRAVRRWRWSPALRGGQPVMVRGEVEIPFVLRITGG